MISATHSIFQRSLRVNVHTNLATVTRFMCTQAMHSTYSRAQCYCDKTQSPIGITKKINKTDQVKVESSPIKSFSFTVNGEMSSQCDRDEDEADQQLIKPLDDCTQDLSHIHNLDASISYNIAKFANKSYVIQELIKLGVKVYKLDANTPLGEFYITRNFDNDVKPYIQFLHDIGVTADLLGKVLSKNLPLIKIDLDILRNRVDYLKSHNFTKEMIAIMTVRCPRWLCQRIDIMDANLGYIQNTLRANGQEIRTIAVKNPSVLLSNTFQLSKVIFSLVREMEFSHKDAKCILIKEPGILTYGRQRLVEVFDYVHNEMGLSRERIAQEPLLLTYTKDRIYTRHEFLKALKRAQFDPKKPLYISLLTFISLSDKEFCNTVCKCSTKIYYQFMKQL